MFSYLEKVNPTLNDTAARNNLIHGLPAQRGSALHLSPSNTFLLPSCLHWVEHSFVQLGSELDKNVPTRKAIRFPFDQWNCVDRVYGRWRSEEAGRREKDCFFQQQPAVRLKCIVKLLHKCNVHTQMNKLQLSCRHT